MKYLIISVFSLFGTLISVQSFAQSTLEDRFGPEAIASIEGTEKFDILQFQNTHGYEIQDLSGIKDLAEYPDALEVAPVSENTPTLTADSFDVEFELFAYNFPAAKKTNQYYRIGETGKLLVVYSIDVVKLKFAQDNSQ